MFDHADQRVEGVDPEQGVREEEGRALKPELLGDEPEGVRGTCTTEGGLCDADADLGASADNAGGEVEGVDLEADFGGESEEGGRGGHFYLFLLWGFGRVAVVRCTERKC
jgi:hypothetical protein